MPQLVQNQSVPQFDTTRLIALSYGVFQHLGWTAELATESRLIGYTKKTWAHARIISWVMQKKKT